MVGMEITSSPPLVVSTEDRYLSPSPNTAAPAPSPKMTQVLRSAQSIRPLMRSELTTSTFFTRPRAKNPSATSRAKRNPGQATFMSKQGQVAPRRFCTMPAKPGEMVSALMEAPIIRSSSSGFTPASSKARWAAATPMSVAVSVVQTHPLVRGLYHVGKVVVGDNLFRRKAARAQNLKAHVLVSRPKFLFFPQHFPAFPCRWFRQVLPVCLTSLFYKKRADLSIDCPSALSPSTKPGLH